MELNTLLHPFSCLHTHLFHGLMKMFLVVIMITVSLMKAQTAPI